MAFVNGLKIELFMRGTQSFLGYICKRYCQNDNRVLLYEIEPVQLYSIKGEMTVKFVDKLSEKMLPFISKPIISGI